MLNRYDRPSPMAGEAEVKYLDGDFRVVRPGAFVRCAVTGVPIPLEELKYWSVDLQEAYATPEAVLQRHAPRPGEGAERVSCRAAASTGAGTLASSSNSASPAARATAPRARRRSSSPCMRARSFSVVTRTETLALGFGEQRLRFGRACSGDDRRSRAPRRPSMPAVAQRREEFLRIADAGKGQHARAGQRRDDARVGLEPRRETPAAARLRASPCTLGRQSPSPTTSSACARASCAPSGARSGPAGKTRPLPMPRAAVDHQHRKILGERRILEAVVHHDDARAGRHAPPARRRRGRARRWWARRAPAAAARRRRRRRDAARIDPHRAGEPSAIAAGEEDRLSPPAASMRATAIAAGVLPAPPTVGLPMQMTGTPARAPGSRQPPRRDRAIDRRERRQQRGRRRRPAATRTAAHA